MELLPKRQSANHKLNGPNHYPSRISSVDSPQTTVRHELKRIVSPRYEFRGEDPFVEASYKIFYKGCSCGRRYENNCAHYLCNAFLLAYPPLTFPKKLARCPHGRLIRAKELARWFIDDLQPGFEQDHSRITYGYWFVYQEKKGQGHVCIHKHDGNFDYRGTGDYPDWPVQWHYYF